MISSGKPPGADEDAPPPLPEEKKEEEEAPVIDWRSLDDEEWDWEAEERRDRARDEQVARERQDAQDEGRVREGDEHPALVLHRLGIYTDDSPPEAKDDAQAWRSLVCFFCKYGALDQHGDEIRRLRDKIIDDCRECDEREVFGQASAYIDRHYGRKEGFQTPAWLLKKHFLRHGVNEDYQHILDDKVGNLIRERQRGMLGALNPKTGRVELQPHTVKDWMAMMRVRNDTIKTKKAAAAGVSLMVK
jgi:hypothetical protein